MTRNDLWIAWEFRPTVVALKWTRRAIGRSFRDASVRRGVIAAFRELSTVLRTRRRVPPDVERALKILDPPRRSRSRRADASGGTPRPKGCCPDVNS